MKGLLSSCTLVAALLTASCEKADIPVALPEKGDAEHGTVEMGEEYKDQVFFDFESGRVVHMSEINSWHLAFEASGDGYHVFLNGAQDVFVYNTHQTDFSKVTSAPDPTSKEWAFDASCGLPDSTAYGDWRANGNISKNEVYIVKLNATYEPNNLKKFRIVAMTDKEYTVEYGDLDQPAARVMKIPKNDAYNYSYFSFSNDGHTLQPDPPKDTWDIVFTRYRIIYYDMDNLTYQVNGVLTNPNNTKAGISATKGFSEVNSSELSSLKLIPNRDVIGHDWKIYNFKTERYDINRDKVFIIHNRNNQYWKMHFIDFYNSQGVKGNPSFEFQRLN